MIHKMHLCQEPFDLIKNGKKTIEIRVFDAKRRRIRLGDTIVFERIPDNKTIRCRVVGLSTFKTFKELLQAFDKAKFGHPRDITLAKQLR